MAKAYLRTMVYSGMLCLVQSGRLLCVTLHIPVKYTEQTIYVSSMGQKKFTPNRVVTVKISLSVDKICISVSTYTCIIMQPYIQTSMVLENKYKLQTGQWLMQTKNWQ